MLEFFYQLHTYSEMFLNFAFLYLIRILFLFWILCTDLRIIDRTFMLGPQFFPPSQPHSPHSGLDFTILEAVKIQRNGVLVELISRGYKVEKR
jgi:hypothetical protein